MSTRDDTIAAFVCLQVRIENVTHKQQTVSDLNPHSLGTISAFDSIANVSSNSTCLISYQEITISIDLNNSSLKWCSLINCNWCVSLDISQLS